MLFRSTKIVEKREERKKKTETKLDQPSHRQGGVVVRIGPLKISRYTRYQVVLATKSNDFTGSLVAATSTVVTNSNEQGKEKERERERERERGG